MQRNFKESQISRELIKYTLSGNRIFTISSYDSIWCLEHGKLKEIIERSRCLLRQREENEVHVILHWSETSKYREEWLRKKWIKINEELVRMQKITIYTKICISEANENIY
jgi:hypothetical protein